MKRIKFILLLTLITLIYGCEFGVTSSQREYLDNLKPIKPTKKELNFMKELELKGFSDVKFDIPIPGLIEKGKSEYWVTLSFKYKDATNEEIEDTLRKISYFISNELYSKVIEDSILVECEEIGFSFYVNTHPSLNSHSGWPQYRISIDALSKINHFKITEPSEGKYERIKI